MLLKRSYLINTIDDNRGNRVKVTLRFFDLKDGIIHATDKTEIEIDDEVHTYIYIYIQ